MASRSPTPQTRFEWKFYTLSSRGGVHSSPEDSAEESPDESLDESEPTATPAASSRLRNERRNAARSASLALSTASSSMRRCSRRASARFANSVASMAPRRMALLSRESAVPRHAARSRQVGGVHNPLLGLSVLRILGALPDCFHKLLVWAFVGGLAARAARELVFLLVLAELALELLVFFAELPLLAGDHNGGRLRAQDLIALSVLLSKT